MNTLEDIDALVDCRGPSSRAAKMLAHIRKTLIAGSLLLIPIALTYMVLRLIFDLVDGVLEPGVDWALDKFGVDWTVPGAGVAMAVVLIYLAGFFIASAMGKSVMTWIQSKTLRVPLVGIVYSATRKLVESFSGKSETGFKRVVLVQYPRSGSWSVGFLTGLTRILQGQKHAVIYIPTAPLPNSGWVAIVPIDEVLDTDMTVQAAMQWVFSGGIISPSEIVTCNLSKKSVLDLLDLS
jgi:uncharacterized membrane protein